MLKSADSHMAGHHTPTPLPAPIREMSLRSSPEKSFLSFLGGKKKKKGAERAMEIKPTYLPVS